MITVNEILDVITNNNSVEVDTDEAIRICNSLADLFQQKCEQARVRLSLPPNVELKDIKDIRKHFGEHDVTVFEHKAFVILDRLVKHLETCGGNAS